MLAEKQRTRTNLREQSLQRAAAPAAGPSALLLGALGLGLLGLAGLALTPPLAPNPQPDWKALKGDDWATKWQMRFGTWTPEKVTVEFKHGIGHDKNYIVEVVKANGQFTINYVQTPERATYLGMWATESTLQGAIESSKRPCTFFRELKQEVLTMLAQASEIMGS